MPMKGCKLLTAGMMILALGLVATAQETLAVALKYGGTGGYSLVERTNLRRYENGKYIGMTIREVRSYISPSPAPDPTYDNPRHPLYGGQWYDGSFYVSEETLYKHTNARDGIHDSIPSVFHISPRGKMTMLADNGYPSFRSFPAFTTDIVRPGDSWSASAERSADPLNKGIFTRIPMEVGYTYVGRDTYQGQSVHRIKAMWQTNYGPTKRDLRGDATLVKATGGHKADILVLASTGTPLLISDTVDETFVYADGKQVAFKGTITLFTEFAPALDTKELITSLSRIASLNPNVTAGGDAEKKDTAANDANLGDGATMVAQAPAGANATDSANLSDNASALAMSDTSTMDGTTTAGDDAQQAHATNALARSDTNANGTRLGDTANAQTAYSPATSGTAPTDGASIVAQSDIRGQDASANEARDANRGDAATGARSGGIASAKGSMSSDDIANALAQSAARVQDPRSGMTGGAQQGNATNSDTPEPAKNNMVVEKTPAGLRLSVRDVRFVPDSSDVLPAEHYRLDEIASVLKLAPDMQFLIEGHTAAVGRPEGEQNLSVERAHKIAEELAKRGVNAAAFICRGWGGTKPIASNATDAGRAQNRRVEITILE